MEKNSKKNIENGEELSPDLVENGKNEQGQPMTMTSPSPRREPILFPALGVTFQYKKSVKAHNDAVNLIVHMLGAVNIPCNYDHIKTNVRKAKVIPLWYYREGKQHRADIAFYISRNRIAYIEIYTREYDPALAKKEEMMEDGEGEQ